MGKLRNLTPQLVFGSLDGFNTALGLVAGSPHLALGLCLAVALAGALSMAWGEFISENGVGWRQALAMGLATATGTLMPCVPALCLPGVAGVVMTVAVGILLALAVGRARGNYWLSLAGFFLVAVPTVVVGMLFGGA